MRHRQERQDILLRHALLHQEEGLHPWQSPQSIGIRPDQAGINGKTFPTYQARLDTAPNGHLEHFAQKVALTKTAMSVLRKCGVIRNSPIQTQLAEPPISEVQMYFFAQTPFGTDAHAVANQQHPNEEFRINRGASHCAVKRAKVFSNSREINQPVNGSKQVIVWYMLLQAEPIKQGFLNPGSLTHHLPTLLD
jgi:hypothetical protein